MIKLNNLTKSYNLKRRNELKVVNNISLELPEKGMVALFGRSGCGKTTLLNLIGGLDKYQSGDIQVIGERYVPKNIDKIRNTHIGYIFQNYNLQQDLTIFENVELSLKIMGIADENIIKDRVMTALQSVDMDKYAKRLPSTLSGGQQQRVAIARALVKSPDILLADEPTGNLDENNTQIVMEILRKIANTRLVVLVTHEQNLVAHYCDRIIEMHDGQLVNDTCNDSSSQSTLYDKNDIYLEDYPKQSFDNSSLNFDVYGSESVGGTIKILKKDGKIFIFSDNPQVKFVDLSSEIKIKENRPKLVENIISEEIQIEQLPPIKYTKKNLFSFGQMFKKGFNTHFRNTRFSQKSIIALLIIASFLSILTSSFVYPSVFEKMGGNMSLEKEVLTVRIDGQNQLKKFLDIVESDNDIKFYSTKRFGSTIYRQDTFGQGSQFNLEVFLGNNYLPTVLKEIILNDVKNIKGKLVCGRLPENVNEIVISTQVAQKYIKDSQYVLLISNYAQLLSTKLRVSTDNYDSMRVVGVVEESTHYGYVGQDTLNNYYIKQAFPNIHQLSTIQMQDSVELQDNEIILYGTTSQMWWYKIGDKYEVEYFDRVFVIKDIIYADNLESKKEIVSDTTYNQLANYYGSPTSKLNVMVVCKNLSSVQSKLKSSGFEVYNKKESINAIEEVKFINIITPILFFIFSIVFMLLCVAFVMRASTISRIKEIGIFRAIGVYKKDILYMIAIETFALLCITIFVGSILAICLVGLINAKIYFAKAILFLPIWLSLALIAILGGICMIFGTLPIKKILKSTPAEILAKYDI